MDETEPLPETMSTYVRTTYLKITDAVPMTPAMKFIVRDALDQMEEELSEDLH